MTPRPTAPDLSAAADAIDVADQIVGTAFGPRREGGPDAAQVFAYDIAHAAAGVATAKALLDYGAKGDLEARITCAYAADMLHDLSRKMFGREDALGCRARPARAVHVRRSYRAPEFLAALADQPGPRHLDSDMEMVADSFGSFARNVIAPHAEHVHRTNGDVPEEIVTGLAELGAFGLSVPAEYGGYSEGGGAEYMAMVVATEELSRASLGIGGSLITARRSSPVHSSRAAPRSRSSTGCQARHRRSDARRRGHRARLRQRRRRDQGDGHSRTGPDGEDGWVINGVKTWCTFGARADALTLLARTDPDRSKSHRGLSLFIVPKPRGDSHGFELTQEASAFDGTRSARWRAVRSTRSATGACTPTRSRSTSGGCPRPT